MASKYPGYIIFDLELTCWDIRNPNYKPSEEEKFKQNNEMEIIEIGAVKTDLNFNIIDRFDIFCKPIKNPILSRFCTNLTSITQDYIDNNAYTFTLAYKKFAQWSHRFNNNRKLPIAYIGWGSGDGPALIKACQNNKIGCIINGGNYINAKELSKLWIGRKARGLKQELERAKLEFMGKQHRAIDDAINTSALLKFYKESILINKN